MRESTGVLLSAARGNRKVYRFAYGAISALFACHISLWVAEERCSAPVWSAGLDSNCVIRVALSLPFLTLGLFPVSLLRPDAAASAFMV